MILHPATAGVTPGRVRGSAHATPVHRPRNPARGDPDAGGLPRRPAGRAMGRARELPRHPAIHRRHRGRHRAGDRLGAGRNPPARSDRHRHRCARASAAPPAVRLRPRRPERGAFGPAVGAGTALRRVGLAPTRNDVPPTLARMRDASPRWPNTWPLAAPSQLAYWLTALPCTRPALPPAASPTWSRPPIRSAEPCCCARRRNPPAAAAPCQTGFLCQDLPA